MATELVTTERNGDVAIVRLANPATLNSLSVPMLEALAAALDMVVPQVRALVVAAEGRAFCSGADLGAATGGLDVGEWLGAHGNPLMLRLRDLPVPWITAVQGAAAGFGAALALAADLVVAADDAYFLLAFAGIGLVPDGGASYLFARSAGRVRAMEAALLGERIPAQQALDWGLVNRVVPAAMLMPQALDLAARLARGPASLRLIRTAVWQAADHDFAAVLAAERRAQIEASTTEDFREGVSAFREKRAPDFRGR